MKPGAYDFGTRKLMRPGTTVPPAALQDHTQAFIEYTVTGTSTCSSKSPSSANYGRAWDLIEFHAIATEILGPVQRLVRAGNQFRKITRRSVGVDNAAADG